MFRRSLFAALLFTAAVAHAVPREVRIVDFWGLLRAVRSISAPSRVIVKLGGGGIGEFSADEAPVLANQRGITSDIRAVRLEANVLQFNNVGEGTWRIMLKREELTIDEVTIEEDPK